MADDTNRSSAPRAFHALLLTLLSIPLLQILPLPFAAVRTVSPARAEIAAALVPIDGPQLFITLSNVPRATSAELIRLAAYILVVLLARKLPRWALAPPIILAGVAEAVLGIAQHYSHGVARGTYANRDHFAALMELAFPFAAALALHLIRRRPWLSGLLLGSAAAILMAIVFSLCRMAFAACLASILVMCAARARRRVQFAAAAVAAICGFAALAEGPLVSRFGELSADARPQIWRETLLLIRDYPMIGCGLGAYRSSFLRYKTVAPMQEVEFAHNDYLQSLAETGILGFGVALALACVVLRSALRSPDYLGLACLGSLAAIALHSLTDFNMYVPENGLAVAWIGGIAVSLGARERTPRLVWISLLGAALTAGIVASRAPDSLSADAASPYRWCDAAETRAPKAEYCINRALELGRNLPPIWMRAANFSFQRGDTAEALLRTARVLRSVPDYDAIIFSYYDALAPPAEVLRWLQPDRRAARAWFRHLLGNGDLPAADLAWDGIDPKDARLAAEYFDALVRGRDYSRAAEIGPLQFQWDIAPLQGVDARMDCSRCPVRIQFDGTANVDYSHVTRRTVLNPGRYRLKARVRTAQLTTDEGVRFRIFDPKAVERLDVSTSSLAGTHGWTAVEKEFTVWPAAELVTVEVDRKPSLKFDNRISGTAWVGDAVFEPVSGRRRAASNRPE